MAGFFDASASGCRGAFAPWPTSARRSHSARSAAVRLTMVPLLPATWAAPPTGGLTAEQACPCRAAGLAGADRVELTLRRLDLGLGLPEAEHLRHFFFQRHQRQQMFDARGHGAAGSLYMRFSRVRAVGERATHHRTGTKQANKAASADTGWFGQAFWARSLEHHARPGAKASTKPPAAPTKAGGRQPADAKLVRPAAPSGRR